MSNLPTQAAPDIYSQIVPVAGAHLQDTLRRREHRARNEVARQIGLINLGTLAGGLAHELSTPLTWVSVELESLETDPLAASVRERVLAARAGTARMREVLIAMRQGARFAGGDLREVMLSHEVDLALTLVTQRMRADGVTLRREYAPDVPLVCCQPTLLGQVLVNLAFVEVEDTGPGIPARLRARIFEPFFSTKGESGNGLGLWISSEIARMHGGELVALSGEKGALSRLTFPTETPAAGVASPRT